jgi:hypothetical protein
VHQLDAVEVEKPMQEVTRRDAEPLSMCARKTTASSVPYVGNSSPATGLQPTYALGLNSPRSTSD